MDLLLFTAMDDAAQRIGQDHEPPDKEDPDQGKKSLSQEHCNPLIKVEADEINDF